MADPADCHGALLLKCVKVIVDLADIWKIFFGCFSDHVYAPLMSYVIFMSVLDSILDGCRGIVKMAESGGGGKCWCAFCWCETKLV